MLLLLLKLMEVAAYISTLLTLLAEYSSIVRTYHN